MRLSLYGRVAPWPNFFQPSREMKNDDGSTSQPKYKMKLLLPKQIEEAGIMIPNPEVAKAKTTIMAVAQAAFGPNAMAILRGLDKQKVPLRNGDIYFDDDGKIKDGYAGQWYFAGTSKTIPRIVGKGKYLPPGAPEGTKALAVDLNEAGECFINVKGKLMKLPDMKKKVPYGGCYVQAVFEVKAGKVPKAGNVMWADLLGVQFMNDGEPFRVQARDDDFSDEADDEADEIAAEGGGDDPFADDVPY